MTIPLAALEACFQGIIPSLVATVAADGTPNISYLSHVVVVDETHIALSNQFFGKTATNLAENPRAMILVVDGRTGRQYQIEALYEGSVSEGPLFERMAAELAASSAEIGMAGVMRLRASDIFRVFATTALPTPQDDSTDDAGGAPDLTRIADVTAAIAAAPDVGAVLDAALGGLCGSLGYSAAIAFLCEEESETLVAVASHGYGRHGVGAEVAFGDGVTGMAARERRAFHIANLSRIQRFGEAIEASAPNEENRTRTIALPALADVASRIAVPMIAGGVLYGVLSAESGRPLADGAAAVAAMSIVARQTAATLAIAERLERDAVPAAPLRPVSAPPARTFKVVHYGYDDSVFIDDTYIIKGLAGRLLVYLLEQQISAGRVDFTNREIRLAEGLRLPGHKDNLETRLLLLQRRLAEKDAPVQMTRTGRGQFRLTLEGQPQFTR